MKKKRLQLHDASTKYTSDCETIMLITGKVTCFQDFVLLPVFCSCNIVALNAHYLCYGSLTTIDTFIYCIVCNIFVSIYIVGYTLRTKNNFLWI